uniref:Uncharacterized protein n=1 Tax=Arundo donax TaxID=35708 RepID=A0A0A9D324_ARUDO
MKISIGVFMLMCAPPFWQQIDIRPPNVLLLVDSKLTSDHQMYSLAAN